jgi:cytochrome c2
VGRALRALGLLGSMALAALAQGAEAPRGAAPAAAAAPAEGAAPAEKLSFSFHSQEIANLGLDALRAAVEPQKVRVFEPYEGREVAFQALPLAKVLDAVYAGVWRSEEELLFTCRDGYQPTVPVARVLAHRAWLAFARDDQPDFSISKQESGSRKRIDLAPFYLVWSNLDDPSVRREGDYGWPYQLTGIDLIRPADHFPKMVPPADAPPAAQEGFHTFRRYCSRCHAIDGEGGSVGPELAGATSPAGARDPAWLRRWIDDPSQVVPTARMPRLDPALPDRAQAIDDLVAYLRAMADAQGSAEGGGS